MKIRHMRKRFIVLLAVLTFLFYLALGAVAPFLRYKEVSQEITAGASFFKEDGTVSCDRAMLLETNTSAWEERLRLFHMAEERIILSTFDMRPGESTRDILAVLLEKADEGVDVKILVDGFSGLLRLEGTPLFYAASSHPNIQIKTYNPVNILKPWKTQGRMHDKYIIVDDTAFVLGGRNTFDYFIGDYDTKNKSFDREVLVYNEAHGTEQGKESSLYQVEAYFEKVWNGKECRLFHDKASLANKKKVRAEQEALRERYQALQKEHGELFGDYDYAKVTYPTEEIQLISGETGIYGKEPLVFAKLCQLMGEAEEKVVIHTPYIVCNDYMYEELGKLAEKVPDIHMMINSIENGDNLVASSDYRLNKGKVVATGLPLYEYDGGYSSHGKSIIIDDEIAIVGSYNMDLRSTYMDTELMLAVKSEGLALDLAKNMEAMEKDCRRVISETEYITPEHIEVETIPAWKNLAFWVIGHLLTPFRCVI